MSAIVAPADWWVPGPGPYLLTHSVGCLSKAAAARLQSHYLAPWQSQGGEAWGDWLGEIEGFRAALAALFGGSASQWCPQANLSSGLAKLLGALPPPSPRRRTWLVAAEAFPSLGFVLRQARRLGYELRLLPRTQDVADLPSWEAAIDDSVCGVLVTHVHSNTGLVSPVADIARRCREQGALCVVDVAQSAGILPWSVEAFDADVVLGSCIKWLCGGPGAGFIWIAPRLLGQLDPFDVGWFSHVDPFEFDIAHWRPAGDARRLWGGTPTVAPFVVAAESLRQLAVPGVAAVLRHNRALQSRFVAELPPAWRARVPVGDIGGTLCLPLGAAFEPVTRALREGGARFDTRGEVLRLSFHLCNDAADATRAAQAWRNAPAPSHAPAPEPT